MDAARRDLLNQLGSELAAIFEEASVNAALLPSVTDAQCPSVVTDMQAALNAAGKLVAAMQALLSAERK
ncbi:MULTISPECIES: hypothetical protein [Sphingomonas]|uniref:hypothetical protein n=1 Tax=Sphingomonas TaxID=13687 RepID=UPI000DEF9804|nr:MULTISPECIES: hypothetical protein [Sphingomonas]